MTGNGFPKLMSPWPIHCQSNSQQIKAFKRFARYLIGSHVNISVSALFWNNRAAALAVEVAASETASDGSGIPRPKNAFTQYCLGSTEFELFERGQAKRLVFSQPTAVLTGTLSFWGQDNESLSL
jgi:hypothetical protein